MSDPIDRLREALGDRYRVERELGRGGMATVFLGEDPRHHRRVAIKVLEPELAQVVGGDRFAREIEFAARLQHPHILTLLDSGAGAGLLWYAMPYVEGESLRARLQQEGRLGAAETARLGAQVARALDYAHRQGVVHRDVKPENILLADRQAMVTDFGIARAIRVAGGATLTGAGVAVGTPEYMSPEQVTAEREVDGRSDVYALGCVLYEMLAGRPPFTGPAETLGHQHLNVAPRSVAELRPGLPAALAAAVDRALAKAPGDRFASAGELADALEGAGATATTAAATPAPRAPSRPRWPRVAVAAGLVLLALGVAWRLGVLRSLMPASPVEAGERRWVWLAAFEGPADDPTLASGARDVIASALDQSGLLASVPQSQIRIALRNAGRPDSARVDEELARQLAYRSNIRVVVSGQITRLGGGYRIGLRAVDSETGQVHLAPAATARDDRALIPTLTGLARELRVGLGERREALRGKPGVFDVMTPSFEAFKLYVEGRRQINANQSDVAIPIMRQAIALDPDFGAAWAGLGTAMGNMGMRDSALAAHREALRHPERLGEAKRLDVLAKIDDLEGHPERARERYDAMIALNPTPVDAAVALNNLASNLLSAGRSEEALTLFRRSAKAWPVEVPPLTLTNISATLIALGRVDEARAMLPEMRNPARAMLALELGLNERQWGRVDSVATVLASPAESGSLFNRLAGEMARAAVQGARGESDGARARIDGMEAILTGPYEIWRPGLWGNRLQLDFIAGRDPDFMHYVREPRLRELATGLSAAWSGDSVRARRSMRRYRQATPVQVVWVEVLSEAMLDRHARRWGAVIGRLAPDARVGMYDPGSDLETARQTYRWMVAEAFAASGQPDSATTYLGLILEPPGRSANVIMSRGLIEPYVRARLVLVLAGSGRVDRARREWETLTSMVTRPDPEVVAKLDEARAMLQSAGAMQAQRR